jgi:phosphoribosylformimino-5-aminoimidazole carboxamide ribotide isomerase
MTNLTSFIIPAIDIIDGKCVRLTKGDYDAKTIYNENPVEVAKQFADAGLQRLHLVDLDGAKKGEVVNWGVLENITKTTNLTIDFSGGLSTTLQVKQCFDAGATYASIGSVAVKNETLLLEWLTEFGIEKFIIGADVNKNLLAIKGWTEKTNIEIIPFLEKWHQHGVQQFFCTDISKDGLMQGPAIDLYKTILQKLPNIKLIASGGISNIKEVHDVNNIGCSGVIIGKAIYEGVIKLKELC